jgi:hypothetical protein
LNKAPPKAMLECPFGRQRLSFIGYRGNCSLNLNLERTVMNHLHSTRLKILAFAFALAGALAGCAAPPSSSSSSGSTMGASGSTAESASGATTKQVNMCNVIRSQARQSNATGGELRAQCDRQLGTDMCTKCLESGL